jgi:hypothetical protein
MVLVRRHHCPSKYFAHKNGSFSRPADDVGRRLTPPDLLDHCITHQFRTPSCLCAENSLVADYVESAIYIAGPGPYYGEYVAGCRFNKCGYLSTSELSPFCTMHLNYTLT